ncbi:Zn-dependent hydrolase [Cordyceps fumosorosea ARSEF 2679]|uniref:Zn-dependent hydrolase n=1 Tax=Cordyceps fumosorosea (strain ARSEF 2679) TaxID=1081104 RepID=A0A167Q0Q6_CORFA|nr:Zn-dependent hydrolase [Cordyceps fumosorosea ARSEF 2679]OAA57185.1 Zn-dependent hydrolase [Cordyceps fumosorosea ARSEF 2679]
MASVNVTFIGTATAILEINGINFITDPFFSPANSEWDVGITVLKNATTPALGLADLPAIDAVLLSHEDHADNLDELGRKLLDGRRVFTTRDGASKLGPRPAVRGMAPWETVSFSVGKVQFDLTATPCQHLPGGECVGFVISGPDFGAMDGKPNGIYFSGDTVYFEELATIRDKFNIQAALINLGAATVPAGDPPLKITMDSADAVQLLQSIGANIAIPMHCDGWSHFAENGAQAAKVFEEKGVNEIIRWLKPGERTQIIRNGRIE